MSMTMIRAKVKTESAADVEVAARRMFSAIEQARPRGVRYASCRLADGATFVILLDLEDGSENPLPTLPAFREFQDALTEWLAAPLLREQLTVIGSYRTF
jgi:hypothetical protein